MAIVFMLSAAHVALGQVSVPHAFVPGTPAKADEVNANFNALVDAINAAKAARVIVVSATGTAAENGTALLAAVSGITDSSSSNRYVVALGPGDYNLGSSSLNLPAGVALEGMGGMASAILTSSAPSGAIVGSGSDSIWVKNLWINATDGVGLYNTPLVMDVILIVSGTSGAYTSITGGTAAAGIIAYGLDVGLLDRVFVDVTTGSTATKYGLIVSNANAWTVINFSVDSSDASSSGAGIWAKDVPDEINIEHSRIVVEQLTDGIRIQTVNENSFIELFGSRVEGSTNAVNLSETGSGSITIDVNASEASGSFLQSGSITLRCLQSYERVGTASELTTSCVAGA